MPSDPLLTAPEIFVAPAAVPVQPATQLPELEEKILAARADLVTPRVNRTGFSQNNEEEIIRNYFSANPPRFGQRLMDIGAWDGVGLSNSRALVLEDWDAILVEAAAAPTIKLMENCRGRKRVRVVQALLVGESTPQPHPLTVLQHTADALSTTDPLVFAAWRTTVKDYFPVMVPLLTVENLLKVFPGPYDFVTLDTEGETLSLFADLINRTRIELICVEHSSGGVSALENMRALAKAKGFHEIAVNGENVIFGEHTINFDRAKLIQAMATPGA